MITREQLSEMSDFDINQEVAVLRGLNYVIEQEDKPSAYLWLEESMVEIDFCNNPNDIMPIIIENKISLEFRDHKSLAPIAKRFGSNSHNIVNDNVLRAACEVYILMNQ